MLSKEQIQKIDEYYNKVKFKPKGFSSDLIRKDAIEYLNNLQILPNQYAYVIDISEGGEKVYQKGIDSNLGYECGQMTNMKFIYSIIHPDDLDSMLEIVQNAWEYGFSLENASPFCVHFMVSYRINKANGETIKILRQSTLFKTDSTNKMSATLSICSDITNLDSSLDIKFNMHGEGGENFMKDGLGDVPQKIKLTPRELEIIKLISQGFSTKQIADQLKISILTVETQRKNMIRKYNMKNTFQLIFWAKDQGLI